MNHIFSQTKSKKILVISFQSLSGISNNVTNVFEIFASFKAANALNHWNLSLIQAVQNCILVGHIDPHVIMLGGSESCLEVIKLAWMKQVLKPPLGFTIQYLGELCNFLVSKTPQCTTAELEEAICKCICELVNTGLPSNLKYIMRHVIKFIPATVDYSFTETENPISLDLVKSILDSLQQKGLVYNTGHGYNVMTADKLRVAKWLGELPDVRMSTVGSELEEKRDTNNVIVDSQIPNRFIGNKDFSENTDDCLSCYDLRGNKYFTQPNREAKFSPNDNQYLQRNLRYRNPCPENDKNQECRIPPTTDSSLNKSRMFCGNVPKKDLPKRPNCIKNDANIISKIICGMKKLRIHWPAKNGIVRSTNIGVQDINSRNYCTNLTDDSNVINSRLSHSMYAFNNINNNNYNVDDSHDPSNTKYHHIRDNQIPFSTTEFMTKDQPFPFIPYSGPKSISPIAGVGCNGINYIQNDIDRSFMLMDDQRCCSELMLTARSSILTPNVYSVLPLQPMTGCEHTSTSDATKIKSEKKDALSTSTINDHTAIAPLNNRYFSPFTCDSGFNSVHGAALQEVETSQSKTSSPPDYNSTKKSSHYNYQQNLYGGGPCTWQVNTLTDSFYQNRNCTNQLLAPVIETSRFNIRKTNN